MKKFTYLLFLMFGVTACSVESIDSTEELLTADAKFKIQEVAQSMGLQSSEICAGEAPVFIFEFPQDTKGNGSPKDTDVHLQLYNPQIEDWESFRQLSYPGAGPEEFTYEDEVLPIGTYSFRAKIGAGGFDHTASLEVVECNECEESFTYVENEDGTYTFTYIPEEDIEGAEVVFTFAQGAYESGLTEEFSQNGKNGQTYEATLDLEKCEVLEYTVTLTPNCNGNSTESNVWTDFKVNDESKKADPDDKFIASCN